MRAAEDALSAMRAANDTVQTGIRAAASAEEASDRTYKLAYRIIKQYDNERWESHVRKRRRQEQDEEEEKDKEAEEKEEEEEEEKEEEEEIEKNEEEEEEKEKKDE